MQLYKGNFLIKILINLIYLKDLYIIIQKFCLINNFILNSTICNIF
jgi:hypothetical protein